MIYWLFYKKKDEEILKFLTGLFKNSYSRDSFLTAAALDTCLYFNEVSIIHHNFITFRNTLQSITIFERKGGNIIYRVSPSYKKSYTFLYNIIFRVKENQKRIDDLKAKYVSMSSM